uniref:Uncharacterized protein n=1 Tax=Rhizophora mucronata TaxID=61149 RepID=A0A2P2NSC0_RHIMU
MLLNMLCCMEQFLLLSSHNSSFSVSNRLNFMALLDHL